MSVLYYFAYGSNMSLARLQARTPSARRVSMCRLSAHRLCFHKIGQDQSAKCDAYYSGNAQDEIFGALYLLDAIEKPVLDQFEGLGEGYAEKNVQIVDGQGTTVQAFCYYATAIDDRLRPFDWYMKHVLTGALEIGVPKHYMELLEQVPVVEDADQNRASLEFGVKIEK